MQTTEVPRDRVLSLAVAFLLLVLTLGVAACGEDDDADVDRSSGSTTIAEQSAFPLTVEHKFGSTTIPSAPRRVVTVGYNEHDFALALGVQPLGVREFIGGYAYKTRPWAQEALGDSEPEIVGAEELNFERIAAVKPDLILGIYSFMSDKDYKRLAKIAPTIAQSSKYPDGATPWDVQLRLTGQTVGREAQADEIVKRVDAEFAQAREEHPEFEGKTAAITYVFAGKPYVLDAGDLRVGFFESLGLKPPAKTGQLSREQMRLLDQDVIVLVQDKGEKVQDDPLFRRLKAAKEGRVVQVDFTDHFAGALGFNSPLSRPFLLKEVMPRLAAALDGNPETTAQGAT